MTALIWHFTNPKELSIVTMNTPYQIESNSLFLTIFKARSTQ
jgi:hypothetical protein